MNSTDTQVAPPATVDPIIWRKELRKACGGISSETVRRWMKEGRLPEPEVKLSLKTMGWKRSTLVARGFPV